MDAGAQRQNRSRPPARAARAGRAGRSGIAGPGLLLGIGLGGFVDGILLHQILQWHHMVSSTERHPVSDLRGLEDNTLADGLFHAASWLATVVAVFLLWRAARRGGIVWSNRNLLGWTLAGWGLFNVVEGLIDHHLLQVHHVREGVANYEVYDAAFLAFGVALLVVGTLLGRAGREPGRSSPPLAEPTIEPAEVH